MAAFLAIAFTLLFIILQERVYEKYWDDKLDVRLKFSSNAVYEGEVVTLTTEIKNAKALPLPWLEVYLGLPDSLTLPEVKSKTAVYSNFKSDIYGIAGNKMISMTTKYRCLRRGYYKLNQISVWGNNLLMSNLRQKHYESGITFKIYPKKIFVSEAEIPYNKMSGEVLSKRRLYADEFEFKGIREYQPYDSLKNINFTASAKAGEYMTNVFDYTTSQEVVLILNLQKNKTSNNWMLDENAICLALFLSCTYIEQNISVKLITNGIDICTDEPIITEAGRSRFQTDDLCEILARIDLRQKPMPMVDMLREIEIQENKTYILISAYHGDDLKSWFDTAREERCSVFWIVPHSAEQYPTLQFSDNIIGWEAGHEL